MRPFFRAGEVCRILGISYRQVSYWDKTDFIKPSYRRSGKYRLYTFSDLLQLKVAAELRSRGDSIQMLRGILRKLRALLPQIGHPQEEIEILVRHPLVTVFWGEMIQSEPTPRTFHYRARDLHRDLLEVFPDTEEREAGEPQS